MTEQIWVNGSDPLSLFLSCTQYPLILFQGKVGLEINAALRGMWQLIPLHVMFLPSYNHIFVMIHVFKLPLQKKERTPNSFLVVQLWATHMFLSLICLVKTKSKLWTDKVFNEKLDCDAVAWFSTFLGAKESQFPTITQ